LAERSTRTATKYNKKDVIMSTNPWNHVVETSETKNTSDCETDRPEVMDDMISNAFNRYVSDGVNFGPDSFEIRVAEQDAFTAGWKAAVAEVAFMVGI